LPNGSGSFAKLAQRSRWFGAIIASVVTGCSSVGSTTCDDYAKLGLFDRSGKIMDALKEHKLGQLSVNLNTKVEEAVDSYCGGPFDPKGNDHARQNGSQPIDKGVAWDDLGL